MEKFKIGDEVDFVIYMGDEDIYPKGECREFGVITDINTTPITSYDVKILGGDNEALVGSIYQRLPEDDIRMHIN